MLFLYCELKVSKKAAMKPRGLHFQTQKRIQNKENKDRILPSVVKALNLHSDTHPNITA